MKRLFVLIAACLMVFPSMTRAQEAPSYIAIEANTGKLLFSVNAEQKRPISTLAHAATTIVALDWAARTQMPFDTMITVPQSAFGIRVGNPMHLQPGDQLSFRDALYAAMLGRDSVSALTVAHFVGSDLIARRGNGSPVGAFIQEMNNLAVSLGMKRTMFRAPDGVDRKDALTTSCAVDLALLGTYCMQNPVFSMVTRQASRRITVNHQATGPMAYDIVNDNQMINVNGVNGIKAGTSVAAGPCLLVSADRTPLKLRNPATGQDAIYQQRMIIVVLGTSQRYTLAKSLLENGWKYWEIWQRSGQDVSNPKEFLQLPKGTGAK